MRKFIPELPQYERPIKLRMLISHTSGLRDHLTRFRLRGVNMDRATGYERDATRGFVVAMSGFEQTGDGAVNTTVEDLLKWDRNFYTPTVGGPRLLENLQTLGHLNDGTELDYASGLFIQQYRGLRNVRHGGAWAGYRAELSRASHRSERRSPACATSGQSTRRNWPIG